MKNVSDEYAYALYLLALENQCSEQYLHELGEIDKILLQNPQYITLLDSPMLGSIDL